ADVVRIAVTTPASLPSELAEGTSIADGRRNVRPSRSRFQGLRRDRAAALSGGLPAVVSAVVSAVGCCSCGWSVGCRPRGTGGSRARGDRGDGRTTIFRVSLARFRVSRRAMDASTMRKIGVVGAGQMGRGIAQVAAAAGLDVALCDATVALAENGKAQIATALGKIVD